MHPPFLCFYLLAPPHSPPSSWVPRVSSGLPSEDQTTDYTRLLRPLIPLPDIRNTIWRRCRVVTSFHFSFTQFVYQTRREEKRRELVEVEMGLEMEVDEVELQMEEMEEKDEKRGLLGLSR